MRDLKCSFSCLAVAVAALAWCATYAGAKDGPNDPCPPGQVREGARADMWLCHVPCPAGQHAWYGPGLGRHCVDDNASQNQGNKYIGPGVNSGHTLSESEREKACKELDSACSRQFCSIIKNSAENKSVLTQRLGVNSAYCNSRSEFLRCTNLPLWEEATSTVCKTLRNKRIGPGILSKDDSGAGVTKTVEGPTSCPDGQVLEGARADLNVCAVPCPAGQHAWYGPGLGRHCVDDNASQNQGNKYIGPN